MVRGLRVLSLFDGISTGRLALERAGIPVEVYYASEIEPSAIEIARYHYPDTIHLGDVTQIDFKQFEGKIDLLIGGSPCQSLSLIQSQTRQNLDGKSKLFFEYVRALEEVKPKWFLLENVASMNKESKNVMSKCLGCYPQLIDSAIFSAQQRPRFYWFNFGNLRKDLVGNKYYTVTLPEDKGIVLKDILEDVVDDKYFYSYPLLQVDMTKQVCAIMDYKNNEMHKRIFNPEFKVHTLTCCNGGNLQKKVMINGRARKMTPLEYERCQTLPDNWTKIGKNQMGVEREQSSTARYNGCGNGWTCDVISHIFSYLPVEVLDECT